MRRINGFDSLVELSRVGSGNDAKLTDDVAVDSTTVVVPDDGSISEPFQSRQKGVAQMRDLQVGIVNTTVNFCHDR